MKGRTPKQCARPAGFSDPHAGLPELPVLVQEAGDGTRDSGTADAVKLSATLCALRPSEVVALTQSFG